MNQRMIAPAFVLSLLGAVAFCVTYVLGGNAQAEGVSLAVAFGAFGTGLILWAKHLLPQDEVIQQRHVVASSETEITEFEDIVKSGAETVTRRKFLAGLGGAAVGAMGIAALFPLRSLGPGSSNYLWHTQWKPGTRLVRENGDPVRPDTLDQGGVLTVWPDGVKKREESATLLIRVPEDEFIPRAGRENWTVQGNVAYSKVCTHVGCPVGLYQEKSRELLCPCHQSAFNVLDGARPVFGPAARSLPQLPLALDAEGYLIAQSDYLEPVGATFWNRDRRDRSEGTAQ